MPKIGWQSDLHGKMYLNIYGGGAYDLAIGIIKTIK
jgi:hypothetical protein